MATNVSGFHHRMVKKTNPDKKNHFIKGVIKTKNG
jgi:hypothetical protein